jgi:pimeloyl-ACP methyl ester carboxylesterase
MYVRIGGIDQWIQIRGEDRNNPIMLRVHGGPGATWTPLITLFLPWEKEFTVVQWDQRGAGKTLEATGDSVAESMSVDRMTQDGIELTEFLRNHLHKNKIILLGHSWGSILGIHMVKQRSDLFSAYVGTGQVANLQKSIEIGYSYTLGKSTSSRQCESSQGIRETWNASLRQRRKGLYVLQMAWTIRRGRRPRSPIVTSGPDDVWGSQLLVPGHIRA